MHNRSNLLHLSTKTLFFFFLKHLDTEFTIFSLKVQCHCIYYLPVYKTKLERIQRMWLPVANFDSHFYSHCFPLSRPGQSGTNVSSKFTTISCLCTFLSLSHSPVIKEKVQLVLSLFLFPVSIKPLFSPPPPIALQFSRSSDGSFNKAEGNTFVLVTALEF